MGNQTTNLSFINPATNAEMFQFNNAAPTISTTNGQLTVLGPTAANVSLAGKVLSSNGKGLINANVTLINASGGKRTVRTNAFGYFRFDEVAAGQVCIFSVSGKGYSFGPQVVSITEDLTELTLRAL